MGNCAVSTYVFDCYPDRIIEVMTFYVVVYNVGKISPIQFLGMLIRISCRPLPSHGSSIIGLKLLVSYLPDQSGRS